MKKRQKSFLRAALVAFALIAAAILLRNLGRELPGRLLSLPRSLIYVGLFSYWGISIHRRVIAVQVRRLLVSISMLMVFWIAERTVKYLFVLDPNVIRALWYLYYLPMILIPFLSLLVAASLGKPGDYKLPPWTGLLYVPVFALVVLVLTNDYHMLVFRFPESAAVYSESDYTRGAGYFVIVAYMALCAFFAVGIMLSKCRSAKGRTETRLPLVLIFFAVVYSVLYALFIEDHTSLFYYVCGDVTVALCLLFAGTLESCLLSGLIPTNTGYDALFSAVGIGMQITDYDYNVRYSSNSSRTLPREILKKTEGGSVFYDKNTVLKGYEIKGGHAVWQEDVSALVGVKAQLESAKEECRDRNEQLRYQIKRDSQRYRLEEQNRLYDLVQRDTQKQLRMTDELSVRFSNETDLNVKKEILFKIIVLSTYIKRRKDMVISSEKSKTVTVGTLSSALFESCSNLKLKNIGGNLYVPNTEALISASAALKAYEIFEEALEAALSDLSYYFVTVSGDAPSLHIELESSADFSFLSDLGATTEVSGGSAFITYSPLGGETK